EKEALKYLARAESAGRPDPDIHYYRAVVELREDPAAAVRDLERYLALTEGRADVGKEKQARVKQTLALVAACVAGPDAKACVRRDVLAKARSMAYAEPTDGGSGEAVVDGGAAPTVMAEVAELAADAAVGAAVGATDASG